MGKMRIVVVELDDVEDDGQFTLLSALRGLLAGKVETEEIETAPQLVEEPEPAKEQPRFKRAEELGVPTPRRRTIAPAPAPPAKVEPATFEPHAKHEDVPMTSASPTASRGGETRSDGGKPMSKAARIVEAFGENKNYPLPKLARELYGDSLPVSINKLKMVIYQAAHAGRLRRLGANSYEPTGK